MSGESAVVPDDAITQRLFVEVFRERDHLRAAISALAGVANGGWPNRELLRVLVDAVGILLGRARHQGAICDEDIARLRARLDVLIAAPVDESEAAKKVLP